MSLKHQIVRNLRLVKRTVRDIHAMALLQWTFRFEVRPAKLSEKPIMVFAPHQDDETFGCGGMIAMKREKGIPVEVVFMTDGSQCFSDGKMSYDALVRKRQEEALAACAILGVPTECVTFLNLPDGQLTQMPGEQRKNAVNRIAHLIREREPSEVLVPHCHDRHKDHEATFAMVREAIVAAGCAGSVSLVQYMVWFFFLAPPLLRLNFADIRNGRVLNVGSVLKKKQQAINVYQSQFPVLSPTFLRTHGSARELYSAPLVLPKTPSTLG